MKGWASRFAVVGSPSPSFSNARLVFKPGTDSVTVSIDLIADCLEDISLSCFFAILLLLLHLLSVTSDLVVLALREFGP